MRTEPLINAMRWGYKPDTTTLPLQYHLFLLGSGGHTQEMCRMMEKNFPSAAGNMHRRYVTTSGDHYSAGALTQLEQSLLHRQQTVAAKTVVKTEGGKGTYDVFMVRRARYVHEPWHAAIFTVLGSLHSLLLALTTMPSVRPGARWPPLPHVVVTNGPGTGFVLACLAHILKVLQMVPSGHLKVVYVESLARVKTLSLTGYLFHLTGIADVFIVQYPLLAEKYKKIYGGFMVETRPRREIKR